MDSIDRALESRVGESRREGLIGAAIVTERSRAFDRLAQLGLKEASRGLLGLPLEVAADRGGRDTKLTTLIKILAEPGEACSRRPLDVD